MQPSTEARKPITVVHHWRLLRWRGTCNDVRLQYYIIDAAGRTADMYVTSRVQRASTSTNTLVTQNTLYYLGEPDRNFLRTRRAAGLSNEIEYTIDRPESYADVDDFDSSGDESDGSMPALVAASDSGYVDEWRTSAGGQDDPTPLTGSRGRPTARPELRW